MKPRSWDVPLDITIQLAQGGFRYCISVDEASDLARGFDRKAGMKKYIDLRLGGDASDEGPGNDRRSWLRQDDGCRTRPDGRSSHRRTSADARMRAGHSTVTRNHSGRETRL